MYPFTKRMSFLTLAGLVLTGLCASPAQAQFFRPGFASPQRMVDPNPYIAPGLTLRQWAYNTAVVGRTYSRIPPYLFGYNPYPRVVNYGPVTQPIYPGYGYPNYGYGYAPLPYGGAGYGGGYDPLYGGGGYGGGGYGGGGYDAGGYSPYYPYYDPYGGYLRGTADIYRSYGDLAMSMEQARIMREMAIQAKIETKKKLIEYEKFKRENVPTFTQEQEDIARRRLQRIRKNSTMPEINSGTSLNILVKDFGDNQALKFPTTQIYLEEYVLKHLNVTKKDGNLGLLREGQLPEWPIALRDSDSSSKMTELTKKLSAQVAALYTQATNSTTGVQPGLLNDARINLDQLSDELSKRVNEVPTGQYIDGKRFLGDVRDALTGLAGGDAVSYMKFRDEFAKGGKSAKELAEYMVRNGLSFAGATPGDEAAYQAAFSALASYNITMHAQLGLKE